MSFFKNTMRARRFQRVVAVQAGWLAALCVGWAAVAHAEDPKLPLSHDEDTTVYVQPKLAPTEESMRSQGATVGVQGKDGRAAYIGTDTSAARPRYSVGGESGGDLSFSAGVESDGKTKHGVKAGVRIRY